MMMMINDDDNGDGTFQDSGDLYIIFTAHYSRETRFHTFHSSMQIPGISLQITLTLVGRDVHKIFTKFAKLSQVW